MEVTAARLVAHGAPLRIETVELAEPGPGEVVVDMAYAGVNPVDGYVAEGLVAPDGPLPRTLGGEGAGRVHGRPVVVRGHGLGAGRDGVWATAAVVPEAALLEVPEGVELAAAAAMGVAGVTAWRTVTELGRVSARDRVLVLGASGGVGSIAVSVAASAGATVWAQSRSEEKGAWLGDLGADRVVACDAAGLAAAVGELSPTVVIDPLGNGFTGAAIEALSPRGRVVLFGTSAGLTGELPLQQLYRKGISVLGYGGLSEPEERLVAGLRQALEALADGRLTVTVDTVLPLAEVNAAFQRLEEHSVKGKLVLDLGG